MRALDELYDEIEVAAKRQLQPSLEALARWRGLVREVKLAHDAGWELEPAFRLRTGASTRWCASNFDEYQRRGLARLTADGRRQWHVSSRPTRAAPGNEQALEDEIVSSYRRAG